MNLDGLLISKSNLNESRSNRKTESVHIENVYDFVWGSYDFSKAQRNSTDSEIEIQISWLLAETILIRIEDPVNMNLSI